MTTKIKNNNEYISVDDTSTDLLFDNLVDKKKIKIQKKKLKLLIVYQMLIIQNLII